MTALCAREVSFAYGERVVLRGVSLDLWDGSIVGLVGPNGSGKTTLLKVLAGLLEGGGEVRYGDEPLGTLSPRARAERRAFVPQGEGEPFPYRVDDVVAMGRAFVSRLYAPAPAGEAVRAALEEVGFSGGLARRFDELSGGERQQVLVARALLQGSSLLLLDEATSHLDLSHRARLVAALKRRARAGAAVLWAVHDLQLAAVSCDAIVVLKEGRVVAQGAPAIALDRRLLEGVYEVPLVVGCHPTTGGPVVDIDPRQWA